MVFRNSNSVSESEIEINSLSKDLNYWKSDFENIIKQINNILSISDQSFSKISDKLQSIYSSSKEISQKSIKITGELSGKEFRQETEKLIPLLDFTHNFLTNSKNKFSVSDISLNEINRLINEASEEVAGFRKLVKHLAVQGISVKIESARLGKDNGFKNLADNINNLADLISNKQKGFSDKAVELLKIILTARTQILNQEQNQIENSDTVIGNVEAGVAILTEKYELSLSSTETIKARTGNIHSRISSLVTAIQFHDIIRQQLENSKNIFNELFDRINKADNQLRNDENLVGFIHEVARLQIAQLHNSKNEYLNAVGDITANLEEINNDVEKILEENHHLFENADSTDGTFTRKIKSEFSGVINALIKNESVGNHFYNSIKNVAETIKILSEFINEISEIGTEIELIALNASIKAAHTGEAGATLGVLAEAIQKLSIDSKKQTNPVIEILVNINKISADLYTSSSDASNEKEHEKFRTISDELNNILSSLDSFTNDAVQNLGYLQNLTNSLGEELHKTVSYINSYSNVDEGFNTILLQLEKIVNSCNGLLKDSKSKIDLDEIKNNYTMQVQRSIHESISLKNKKAAEEEISADPTGEFGDNVELF